MKEERGEEQKVENKRGERKSKEIEEIVNEKSRSLHRQ
jgi:hypothetical protein